MDFELSDEQKMFRDLFRGFAEKEVAPQAEHDDRSEEPPVALFEKAAAQGFMGATLPEAYGGGGGGLFSPLPLLRQKFPVFASLARAPGPPPDASSSAT